MNKLEDYKIRINELLALADQTLASQRESQYGGVYVDGIIFAQFRSGVLSFIKKVFGEEHPYYRDFNNRCKDINSYESEKGKGILKAIKQEIDGGWLFTLKNLVTAEVFSDFLEMAKYLLEQNYKDPAAVMIGSVLEEHLRQLCLINAIQVDTLKNEKMVFKKADQLNSDLATQNIYNKLDQKNVTAWLDLRNKAAHGKYDEYLQTQVELMYSGVLDFITRST